MIKREDVIFDPRDPRAKELIGKKVLGSDYYDMRDAEQAVYISHDNSVYPFICDTKYFTFITSIPIPEQTYRPFKNAEEFKPYRDKWIVEKATKIAVRVTSYEEYGARVIDDSYIWSNLFKLIEFEDGTPFGVKE